MAQGMHVSYCDSLKLTVCTSAKCPALDVDFMHFYIVLHAYKHVSVIIHYSFVYVFSVFCMYMYRCESNSLKLIIHDDPLCNETS